MANKLQLAIGSWLLALEVLETSRLLTDRSIRLDHQLQAKSQGPRTKAQVATEFFLYAGVFLIIVIFTFGIVSSLQVSEINLRESILSKEVGDSFSDAIVLAVRSGDGFRFNMTFKKTLISKPYEVLFDDANGGMYFTWQGTYGNITNFYPIPLYAYQFTGCTSPSKKIISNNCKNVLSLYNNGSKLFVNQPS